MAAQEAKELRRDLKAGLAAGFAEKVTGIEDPKLRKAVGEIALAYLR